MITGSCKLKVRARVETLTGLIDFSDIVMLRSGPNSCCQQNFKCSDMLLLSLGLFS